MRNVTEKGRPSPAQCTHPLQVEPQGRQSNAGSSPSLEGSPSSGSERDSLLLTQLQGQPGWYFQDV